MGDEQGQGGLGRAVIFLDENHCRNRHVIAAIESSGLRCEKLLDYFEPGAEDVIWLPEVGRRGWCLLTTDARIKSNYLERQAIRQSRVRMFYFSRNNLSGQEMGLAVAIALPAMISLVDSQPPPFIASISRLGEVKLRNNFGGL